MAAAPSAAAATGSALLAACGSCLGLSAAGATASSGFAGWQVRLAIAVFPVLIAIQLRRSLAAARCRTDPGGRAAFVLRQTGPSLVAGAVAFAAVQLLVVPWLSAPPVPARPTLP